MNWGAFKTYEMGYRSAFETLNNQLFERYIKRTYGPSVVRFRVINGAGGDGGVEAYAAISNGDIIAVQSKWFLQSLSDNEIGQIKKSILTAKTDRPQIKEYIICIPHDVNSQKIGRGKTITVNHEEKKINDLIDV
jgi:predicted helicase